MTSSEISQALLKYDRYIPTPNILGNLNKVLYLLSYNNIIIKITYLNSLTLVKVIYELALQHIKFNLYMYVYLTKELIVILNNKLLYAISTNGSLNGTLHATYEYISQVRLKKSKYMKCNYRIRTMHIFNRMKKIFYHV